MTLTLPATTAVFDEPAGLSPRGTLVVLAGRGEAAGVYERFGRRISADSWRVRVVAGAATDPDAASEQVLALLANGDSPAPRILVGSDAGAALALGIAASHPESLESLVLAGLPTNAEQRAANADPELRSACPVHRKTLDNVDLIEADALAAALPSELALPAAAAVAVPVLAVHGDADTVVPVDDALAYLRGLPDVRITTVRGGRHDVLNDVSHRSVAATIILFLEALKAGSTIVETV
jgi:alpha-beta hydrolase superfamily lysophospholipase